MNHPLQTANLFFFGELLLVGMLLHLMPQLTRPDIYFAITVPPSFRETENGKNTLRQFRVHLWMHTLLGAGLLTSGLLLGHVVLMLTGVYWQVIGAFLSFQAARRKTMPYAVAPSTEREARLAPRTSGIPGAGLLHVGPFALLAASALYLRAHWNEIPERFPVHWGIDGRPNGWASRTIGGVYGSLGIGAVMCAMLVALWYLILYGTRQVRASGPSAENEARFRTTQLVILMSVEYLLAFMFTWASLFSLRAAAEVSPHGTGLFLVGALVYLFGIVALLIHTGQGGSRLAGSSSAPASGSGAPVGDRTPDKYWKLGLIYVNRDDPAILVEKRFGIGYTLNLGHPLTWVVLAVLLVPVAVSLVIGRHIH